MDPREQRISGLNVAGDSLRPRPRRQRLDPDIGGKHASGVQDLDRGPGAVAYQARVAQGTAVPVRPPGPGAGHLLWRDGWKRFDRTSERRLRGVAMATP